MTKVKSKYKPLHTYLSEKTTQRVKLSMEELENILGFTLPKSATDHMNALFWSNDPHPDKDAPGKYHHYHTLMWLSSGYMVSSVDFYSSKHSVTFTRIGSNFIELLPYLSDTELAETNSGIAKVLSDRLLMRVA
jgi:hypothetical protein